ncbi:PIR Superfamily Protein [Plasmodium ovale wallikeri]|uniref:PIR Superfamily Protein n=1 Tax=Plasmodium ovale wallikeri TaxID=864142 RepID=A0A1A9A3F6_PLAOA|nr:PIR Superfamily Protein [Plasmodium ovale wallikeri]
MIENMANKELEKYYKTIESLYNENSTSICGHDAEVADCEATEGIGDHQGSYSDKSFHNDQTYNIFLSKFAHALVKLLDHYDDSSLLQYDHNKQCVYFKYWFYDKIIKNILSDKNLHHFYEALEDEDKDLEDQEVSRSIKEVTEELEEVFLEQDSEEEEEELEDGSSLDSEEDDTEESEDTQEGKSQHRYKSEDNDSDEILLSLDKSNHCNIYKLELNQIKDIKILYDYLEDKSKNRSSIETISKSTYCSTFNKTIELYNDKRKCKSYDFVNEYCREVEECRKNNSLTNISILRCAEAESTSGTVEQAVDNKELGGERPPSLSSERGAGSDGSLSSGLLDTKPENLRGELGSTALHYGDNMKERQPFVDGERITDRGNLNTHISSSDIIRGSHLMDTEASNSCHNGSVGRSCKSSLQQLAAMPTEKVDNLKQLRQENTNMNSEPDTGLQEENGSTNTIVSSASSVLGVSALLFMLYKFTPLGSLINNRRGGINTWEVNEEGYDENLLFSSALGNTNSNNNNYSIGYYSLGNT